MWNLAHFLWSLLLRWSLQILILVPVSPYKVLIWLSSRSLGTIKCGAWLLADIFTSTPFPHPWDIYYPYLLPPPHPRTYSHQPPSPHSWDIYYPYCPPPPTPTPGHIHINSPPFLPGHTSIPKCSPLGHIYDIFTSTHPRKYSYPPPPPPPPPGHIHINSNVLHPWDMYTHPLGQVFKSPPPPPPPPPTYSHQLRSPPSLGHIWYIHPPPPPPPLQHIHINPNDIHPWYIYIHINPPPEHILTSTPPPPTHTYSPSLQTTPDLHYRRRVHTVLHFLFTTAKLHPQDIFISLPPPPPKKKKKPPQRTFAWKEGPPCTSVSPLQQFTHQPKWYPRISSGLINYINMSI